MTRDGIVSIKFNKEMIVPDFAKNLNKKNGRNLEITMDQLDVSRDLVDIKFISKTDAEEVNKEYFLSVHDWSPSNFDVFINFTDPMMVSQGDQDDQVVVSFKNVFLFQPSDGGATLKPEDATVVSSVPKQLPKGVSAEDL